MRLHNVYARARSHARHGEHCYVCDSLILSASHVLLRSLQPVVVHCIAAYPSTLPTRSVAAIFAPWSTMARSIRKRLLPVLRAILAPACAIIAFSCLLTFFFVLYQPTRGPEAVQRLGWQAWAVVSPQIANQVPLPNDGSSTGPVQGDVDWWNVTTEDSSVDTANLPLDVWAPLLPHDTGCK